MPRSLLLLLACLLPPVLGVAAWGFTAWRLEVNAAPHPAATCAQAEPIPSPEPVAQAVSAPVQAVFPPPVLTSTPDSDYDDYEDWPPDAADSDEEGVGPLERGAGEGCFSSDTGAHRMKEALAVCKVQVNPIELWQLEDKQYTIRVAGKESAETQPPAGVDPEKV